MVSALEISDVLLEQWNCLGIVQPGCVGTFAQNLPEGERTIYHFVCDKNDTTTSIYKRPPGSELDINSAEIISNDMSGFEQVAMLKKGQAYYLSILPDGAEIRRVARIRHM